MKRSSPCTQSLACRGPTSRVPSYIYDPELTSNNRCESLQIDLSTLNEEFSLLLSCQQLQTSPPSVAVSVVGALRCVFLFLTCGLVNAAALEPLFAYSQCRRRRHAARLAYSCCWHTANILGNLCYIRVIFVKYAGNPCCNNMFITVLSVLFQ